MTSTKTSPTTEKQAPRLVMTPEGLTLTDDKLELRGDFREIARRLTPNNLHGELVVKAAKIRGSVFCADRDADMTSPIESVTDRDVNTSSRALQPERPLRVFDATAGLGTDSFLLAAAGFEVDLYEYDEVIAALLRDAIQRASEDENLNAIVERMRLHEADSIVTLRQLGAEELAPRPDIIFLDPMFPERQKSALVKKKFQLLQQLERPCADEEELLAAAIAAKPRKIIIKRPLKGPYLAGRKPSYSLKGKAIRMDCIVLS